MKLPVPTLVPLNLTSLAPVKLVPVIVTEVPTGPEGGEKLVIVGSGGGVDWIGSGVRPIAPLMSGTPKAVSRPPRRLKWLNEPLLAPLDTPRPYSTVTIC